MNKHRFNIYPEMQPDEFYRLKENIYRSGFDKQNPIVLHDDAILDGWNRYRACNELDVDYETTEFTGSDEAALEYVQRSNVRRNITSSQRACIAVEADELMTALKVQAKQCQGRVIQLVGCVNKVLAKKLGTNHQYISDAFKLKASNADVFESVKKGELNIKEAKRVLVKQERARLIEVGKQRKIDDDFRKGHFMDVFKDLKPGSVDCIITDPPYKKEYIDCWSDLAKFAKKVLKPNGFCIAYSGQAHLPQVMQRMNEHLQYYWIMSLYHRG